MGENNHMFKSQRESVCQEPKCNPLHGDGREWGSGTGVGKPGVQFQKLRRQNRQSKDGGEAEVRMRDRREKGTHA